MSNRWTEKEKIYLVKLYSDGLSYKDIAIKLSRSPNAVKIRLETIVYNNIQNGRKKDIVAKSLNISESMVRELYNSRKKFIDTRKKKIPVDDGMRIKEMIIDNEKILMRKLIENHKLKKHLIKLYGGKIDIMRGLL